MEIRKGYKKIVDEIQVISFQCSMGNGQITDKQYQYLLKGLVKDSIVLLLIEDAIKSYEENKDLQLALSKVGISIKDGITHSKELGGKLFNIETEINLLADVIEDYVPENLLKHANAALAEYPHHYGGSETHCRKCFSEYRLFFL